MLSFLSRSWAILLLLFTVGTAAQESRQYYLLQTYTLASSYQEDSTDGFLEKAYLPALKRIKLGPIGVFKDRPGAEDSLSRVYVLIPMKQLTDLILIDGLISTDPKFAKEGTDFLSAPYDKPRFQRKSSTVLMAFADMPQMKPTPVSGPRADRVYELRSYESPTPYLYRNKVNMFNEGGEINLFRKLNFNAVFYAEVLTGNKQPNLMYMTTFENLEARDQKWKEFVDSPEWKEMSSRAKYQNNVSHADILLLYPTQYSDY